jgi:large subunit ribosomal protein L3
MKGLLGRKLGMTQVFTVDGTLIPVTVVEVSPNVVLQKKTIENDGYEAVQLGYSEKKAQRATKALVGHVSKANTTPKQFIKEIRGNGLNHFEVGALVKADLFTAGEMVDVSGTSKGHGYNGAVVRNNQRTGPNSHGSGFHRAPGSIATIGRNNGIINKGRTMAGQMGGVSTTNQNLEVVLVDTDKNVILIKGNVPGPKRGFVVIKSTVKPVASFPAKVLVNRTPVVVAPEVVAEVVEAVEEAKEV